MWLKVALGVSVQAVKDTIITLLFDYKWFDCSLGQGAMSRFMAMY